MLRRTPLVGAYACPQGVFVVECVRGLGESLVYVARLEVVVVADVGVGLARQVLEVGEYLGWLEFLVH